MLSAVSTVVEGIAIRTSGHGQCRVFPPPSILSVHRWLVAEFVSQV